MSPFPEWKAKLRFYLSVVMDTDMHGGVKAFKVTWGPDW